MFLKLTADNYKQVLPLYTQADIVFPLMLAVLKRQQRGLVFVDDQVQPQALLVVNGFGFMQFTGDSATQQSLLELLQQPGDHTLPPYLLWYAPPPSIQSLLDSNESIRRRERMRFQFNSKTFSASSVPPLGFSVQPLDHTLLEAAREFNLEIDSRFWASADDFLAHGLGVGVLKDSKIVSLCYSACVVDGLAEVDIVTHPEYRGRGLGETAARAFITICLQRGIIPTWDCFLQNSGSMNLAKKLGFEPTHTYPLYSFNTPLPNSTRAPKQ